MLLPQHSRQLGCSLNNPGCRQAGNSPTPSMCDRVEELPALSPSIKLLAGNWTEQTNRGKRYKLLPCSRLRSRSSSASATRRPLKPTLPQLGFHCETPRTFERNILFDTPDHRLRASTQILRVRRYGDRWVLTHKQDHAQRTHPRRDTKSASKPKLRWRTARRSAAIFKVLGYTSTFVYENGAANGPTEPVIASLTRRPSASTPNSKVRESGLIACSRRSM